MTVQAERRSKRAARAKWYLAGPLASAAALFALLYLCALALARELLPFTLMEELVIACVFVSGAVGGVTASGFRGEKAVPTGAAVGAALAALIVVVTLIVPGEGAFNARCLRHVIAAVCGGAFGGALGIKRVKRPPKKRRRK